MVFVIDEVFLFKLQGNWFFGIEFTDVLRNHTDETSQFMCIIDLYQIGLVWINSSLAPIISRTLG